jgi:hypothetical protein
MPRITPGMTVCEIVLRSRLDGTSVPANSYVVDLSARMVRDR